MKIYIGSDHAGFEMKREIVAFLRAKKIPHEDVGPIYFDPEDDYPDYVGKVAEAVSKDPVEARGVVIGGSGQGEAMVANKFPHVRAVVFNGQYKPEDGRFVPEEIMLTRQHNDSNILALGARFLSIKEAVRAIELWINTPFSGEERHIRRVEKINKIESIWMK